MKLVNQRTNICLNISKSNIMFLNGNIKIFKLSNYTYLFQVDRKTAISLVKLINPELNQSKKLFLSKSLTKLSDMTLKADLIFYIIFSLGRVNIRIN